jgi:hypothetical protein
MVMLIGAQAALLPDPARAQLTDAAAPQAIRLDHLSAEDVLAIAGRLIDAGRYAEAQALLDQLARDGAGGIERDFLDGMIALARKDYARAERLFRKILEGDRSLLRVRLELARTLFLEKKDEQADYQFRLAIAERPPEAVVQNITRFREAIRARRAWRVNVNFGIVPDSNINSATRKEQIIVLGLPFRLDPSALAKSGVGIVAGGDASLRLLRDKPVPLYLAAYGRMLRYRDHNFDDVYIGGEAGPEFRFRGGRLRPALTVFQRWYGGKALTTSYGGRLAYDKVIRGRSTLEAALALRRDDFRRRRDLDSWSLDASAAIDRALNASTLGFAYVGLRRNIARDRGYAYWNARLGAGVLKEIGWGLRPQLQFEVARQFHDRPIALFGRTRRDWEIQASASIYKRDWNVAGFAPAIKTTYIRTFSTIVLYDQRRWRTDFTVTKAF